MTTSTGGFVSAVKRLHGAFHVTAITQNAANLAKLDVTIESDNSSSFAAPVPRLTFSQVGTVVTSQIKTATGPITDDWFRAKYVITDTGAGVSRWQTYLTVGAAA